MFVFYLILNTLVRFFGKRYDETTTFIYRKKVIFMWLWMHLVSWAVLIIAAGIALFSKTRQFLLWTMITRVCYLVSIVSGIVLMRFAFARNPLLTVVKILIAIGLIGLIEIAFAGKKDHRLSKPIVWSTLAALVLVTVAGFALAQFRPFI